ncbi:phosphoesterase [Actinorhabdospora filicis]|uniref:Phosphoesterase n=1 Tax=Actinorhabdospora filicis TaxID=1785913 RepID=A0A9W6SRN7_9ACTN|nr:2'-5' RNA ligase family protein [Actinorhabdospora filicis]GLZ80997.1 phosphoesterase [Actinorhabdospora filicis]
MARIGVAIAVPEPWGSELRRHRMSTGDPQAEIVPTHVTLLAPVEIADGDLPGVEEHLASVAARHAAFTLLLRGTGTFRPVTEVVFVAVAAGIAECERLAASVRTGPLTYEARFPYHPHVTVAHDVDSAHADRIFDELAGYEARFGADDFVLYAHGPDEVWRERRRFALTGPDTSGELHRE